MLHAFVVTDTEGARAETEMSCAGSWPLESQMQQGAAHLPPLNNTPHTCVTACLSCPWPRLQFHSKFRGFPAPKRHVPNLEGPCIFSSFDLLTCVSKWLLLFLTKTYTREVPQAVEQGSESSFWRVGRSFLIWKFSCSLGHKRMLQWDSWRKTGLTPWNKRKVFDFPETCLIRFKLL